MSKDIYRKMLIKELRNNYIVSDKWVKLLFLITAISFTAFFAVDIMGKKTSIEPLCCLLLCFIFVFIMYKRLQYLDKKTYWV